MAFVCFLPTNNETMLVRSFVATSQSFLQYEYSFVASLTYLLLATVVLLCDDSTSVV